MNDKVFVDTNVFVYLRDEKDAGKQTQAATWISHLWRTGNGRLSMQVLSEYYSVVTQKLKPGLDVDRAREDVADLMAWQPETLTLELIREGWFIQDHFQVSWWDALIVASAKRQGCSILLSEDFHHHQAFDDLIVTNPFLIFP
jgi:predicted nucleic acid-binding protein